MVPMSSSAGRSRRPRRFLSSSDFPRRNLSFASSSSTATEDDAETATNSEEDFESNKSNAVDIDDETDRQRAAKKLRRKRIAAGRKKLRESQKPADEGAGTKAMGQASSIATDSLPLQPIETMNSETFASFYDETVTRFHAAEVERVLKNLTKATSGKQAPSKSKKGSKRKTNKTNTDVVASLPIVTILTGMLRETKSAKDSSNSNNNLLQTQVLEFLVSGTTTREGDDASSVATAQSSDSSSNELKAKFVDTLKDLQKLTLAEKAAVEKDSSLKEVHVDRDDGSEGSEEEGVKNIDEMFSQANKPKKPKKKRSQRRYNFVFEALPMFVNTTAVPKAQENPARPTTADLHATDVADRVVFVDNLPIDITVEELDRLYRRFGALASVRIFNQRIDLDPGPLNKSDKAARLKKQIKATSLENTKWQRPCSPVYAQVTYTDEKGCQEALDDSLRIFGMIIQRHPARSIRSSDMTQLYIEDIPNGYTYVDIEYELSRLLDPDLYILLGGGQNNRAEVGGCEIRFSSFQWASHAFQKLETLNVVQDEENDCRVNWLKTPDMASKWWTRKIGFN